MHIVKQKNATLQSTRVNYCYISIWCWLQYGMVSVARSSLHLNFTNFYMHYLPLNHFKTFCDAPNMFWWIDTDHVFHVFAFEFPTYTIYISFPFSYTISIYILSNINRWLGINWKLKHLQKEWCFNKEVETVLLSVRYILWWEN